MSQFAFISSFFIFLLVLAVIVPLLVLRVFFLVASKKKSSEPFGFRCILYIQDKLTKRFVLTFFVLLPLCLTIVIVGLDSQKAPRRGRTLQKELQNSTTLKIISVRIYDSDSRTIELYKTSNADEIKKIVGNIAFKPSSSFLGKCKCHGDMIFEFYRNDEFILEFSFHHGNHFRIADEPIGDLNLTLDSKEFFNNWVTEKGISKNLEEYLEQGAISPIVEFEDN